jgi:NAD(P)-dependent dehydrogenase (short-subunit alcohol dehydrogenase family)
MNVMIIGGTSGIGLALARHYVEQGARVTVCGRHPGKLDGQPLLQDARLSVRQLDIIDRDAVTGAIREIAENGLDLLVVTAGQYADAAAIGHDRHAAMPVLKTNIGGLDHAFSAAADAMIARGGQGQLVAVASIAGLQDEYPNGSLYSATKRAAIAICDSYRKALAPFGVAVTAIIPGYIDTARLRELNHGDASHKPWLMTEAQAVERIAAAIARRAPRCIFPWQLHALVRVFNALPLLIKNSRQK